MLLNQKIFYNPNLYIHGYGYLIDIQALVIELYSPNAIIQNMKPPVNAST